MLIAIDTSTDIASLALVREGVVLAELTWRSNQNHTTQLTPNIDYLLRTTSAGPEDLSAVVVGKGPGSFNGLRVGVSVAKGIAFSLNLPIIGINSLEAESFQFANTGLPVCPVFSAGRDEAVFAVYDRQDTGWKEIVAAQIGKAEAIVASITGKTYFCGEYLPRISSKLRELLGDKAVFASPMTDLRRASTLAELGLKKLLAGDVDNTATLSPLYLRRPPITTAKPRFRLNISQ